MGIFLCWYMSSLNIGMKRYKVLIEQAGTEWSNSVNHNIILTGTMGVRVQGLKFTSSVKHMEIFSNPSGPTQKVYIADVDKIRARQLSDGMSIYISSLIVS